MTNRKHQKKGNKYQSQVDLSLSKNLINQYANLAIFFGTKEL